LPYLGSREKSGSLTLRETELDITFVYYTYLSS